MLENPQQPNECRVPNIVMVMDDLSATLRMRLDTELLDCGRMDFVDARRPFGRPAWTYPSEFDGDRWPVWALRLTRH